MKKRIKKISATGIFVVIVALCIVIIAAAAYKENKWYAGICMAEYSVPIPVNESKITKAQYRMWEGIIAQKILNNYSDITLDVTKDTIADYLEIEVDKDIYTVLSVNIEASKDKDYMALGRPIQNALYDEMVAQAEEAGINPKHYVKMLYGANITLKRAKEVFLLREKADDYINWLASDISEKEYADYYLEHSNYFDEIKTIVVSADSSNENMELFLELKEAAEVIVPEKRMDFIINEIDDIGIDIKTEEKIYSEYSNNSPDAFKVWLYGKRTYGDIVTANTDKCYLVFYESRSYASGDWKTSAKEKIIEIKKESLSSEIRRKYTFLKR